MTDLLPGQLVDVEFRWRVPKRKLYEPKNIQRPMRLQSRKLLKNDSGELNWTEWADVPVVEEG